MSKIEQYRLTFGDNHSKKANEDVFDFIDDDSPQLGAKTFLDHSVDSGRRKDDKENNSNRS